jgi:hypothetical protein
MMSAIILGVITLSITLLTVISEYHLLRVVSMLSAGMLSVVYAENRSC